jgi:hypothetical protein
MRKSDSNATEFNAGLDQILRALFLVVLLLYFVPVVFVLRPVEIHRELMMAAAR